MNLQRRAGAAMVALLIAFGGGLSLRADDASPPSLEDVHKLLVQAAGDSSDNTPPADQQTEILHHALEMIHRLPHVYHGELNRASRSVEAALVELSTGDAAHQARHDILDADDLIRSIMP